MSLTTSNSLASNKQLNTFSYNQICLIIGYPSVQSAHEPTLGLAQAFVFEAVVDVEILKIKTFRLLQCHEE